MESGGAPYNFEREVSTTFMRTMSFEVDFGLDFQTKFPGVRTHNTFQMSMRNYAELEAGQSHVVAYEIYDDDPDDFFVMGKGVDQRFGTYIFNSSSFYCETSDPYEHNTWDYLPPVIEFPEIDLDSDDDLLGPTTDDTPIVTVDIFEEGGIQEAIIWYSTNNGSSWEIAYLSELSSDPGTWRGTIPAQPFNTTVLWYIQAWDNQGNNATRYDDMLQPYEYTVIKKLSVPPEAIPGFPPVIIILILIAASTISTIIYHRKHIKFKR